MICVTTEYAVTLCSIHARETSLTNSEFYFFLLNDKIIEGTWRNYRLKLYWFAKGKEKSFRETIRTMDAHDPNGISSSVFHGRDWAELSGRLCL